MTVESDGDQAQLQSTVDGPPLVMGDSRSAPQPSLFHPEAEVDHFRVMRLIGRGGMGEVYLARDTKLGRKVALKVINPRLFSSQRAIERFLFEARTTARFNHPHIVTVYAVGEHEGKPYVALEYLEGQTLRQRMEEERPSAREVMRIGLAIAEALQEAQQHKVLHQDLKPENVLIPRDGRLRVVDFGLATVVQSEELASTLVTRLGTKVLGGVLPESQLATAPTIPPTEERRASLAQAETIIDDDTDEPPKENEGSVLHPPKDDAGRGGLRGTPQYMAPEQWLEQELSGATDIWALGVILYELVAGKRPYHEANNAYRQASQVVSREPVPRDPALDQIPKELSDLILCCLEKEPPKRATAEQAATALEQMLATGRRLLSQEQSPFRGLLPFGEQHTDYFFGRDAEVSAFLERIREEPVLPVVGPSGAGKSSFIQAGVIPRLREQAPWIVLRLRPGNDPFRTLASRLVLGETTWSLEHTASISRSSPGGGDEKREEIALEEAHLARQLSQSPSLLNLKLQQIAEREQARVLLFVDQLEELYTLVEDETVRDRFMQALCTAADDPHDPVRVIFTLREDFLGRLSGGTQVRSVMGKVTVIWSPGVDLLEEILTRPLKMVGYSYDDPSLTKEMVSAVGSEPACLPLLQFTGRTLWERRDRTQRVLRRADYEAIGGVAGALARHADSVLEGLTPSQMHQARELILRLVTADGTRKVLPRTLLLEGLAEAAEEVLSRLIQARLISTRKAPAIQEGDVNVELAHESLVKTWDRLARWIDESREDLVILGELTQAADLWLKRGQRAEEVWQGEALQEARRYLARGTANIPQRVARFIEAGMKREQRRVRRKRALVISLIIVPTIVAVLFIAKEREAIYQKERAEQQRTRAEDERKRARKRWAEAQREGARAALAQEATLEARAKVRGSLERQDSLLARVLWWRLQQQPLLWKKELGNGVYHLAFSPDGKTLAAACQDTTIYLFDIQTKATRLLRGHRDQVFSVAFSPDGRTLASGGWDNTVRLWDLSKGEVKVLRGHKRSVRSVTFSPDGRLLASCGGDRTVRIWDLASKQTRWILKGHKQTVYSLAASPDGTYLASSGRDTTVMVWNLRTGALAYKLTGHRDGVEGLGFSPDGKRLASGSWDRTIRIWDLTSGKPLYLLEGHAANVEDVVFSPDGRQIASSSWDQTIRIWDLASRQTVRVLRGHTGGLYTMAQSPDGRLLASGSWDKSVRVWHRGPTENDRVEPAGHTGAVYGVTFSSDGKTLVTGSLDKTVRLWDVRTGAQRSVLRGHTNAVEGVAITADGRYLASGGSDMSVRIWDLSSDTQKRMLLGHTAEITGMSFSIDGKLLATASLDKTVRLWDWGTGTLARVLRGHAAGVRIVAFSRDGRMLATGSHDHTARVWWLARGVPRLTVTRHAGAVFGASFSPDSQLLATGSQDQTIRLHDLARGTSRLVGRHDGRIYMIDYHPKGTRIGAPSSDGVARIWDLRTGRSIPLTGHRSEVNYLRFSPKGQLAATTSDDGTVRLWEVESGRPHWRAPLMLPKPPRLLTHLGWIALAPKSGARTRPSLPEASWRRATEKRARLGSVTADGKQLCLSTTDGKLEHWDLVGDWRLFSKPASGLQQVLAVPDGCVTLAAEQQGARLLTKGRPIQVLRADASAIALDKGEILVAAGKEVQIFSASGQRRSSIQGGGIGVSTLRRVGRWLALGFANGSIELIPIGGGEKPTFSFEQTPSSPVVRLVEGPMRTLIAGFANGLVGIWNLNNGSRLYHIRLHGAVHHLLLEDRHLYAATDLGQHAVLDLGVLHVGYCDLLAEVWRRIPVLWEQGLPVLRPPPEGHRCR